MQRSLFNNRIYRSRRGFTWINPEILLILILATAILVPVAVDYLFCCYILLMYILTSKSTKFTVSMFPVIPILLLFPVGALFALNNDGYDALKDVWYLSKIVILFSAAFMIALRMRSINRFFELYVGLSLIVSTVYLVRFFSFGELDSGGGLNAAYEVGVVNISTVFALPLLLRQSKHFVFIRGSFMKSITASTMLSTALFSFSRTYIFCSILAFLATVGMFRNFYRSLLSALIIAVLVGGVSFYLIATNQPDDFSFGGKILNSLNELYFTGANDQETMILHWRGYESFMAWSEFQNSSLLEQMFGRGFGATVDLGLFVNMSEDMVLRYLPLLHNGYSQVIAKYGVVGLLLYVLFILGVVRGSNGWETTSRGNLLSDMRVGVGIIIAFTSLDITGLFNKSALDGICILLGAIYGYALAQGRHDDLRASSAKLNSV